MTLKDEIDKLVTAERKKHERQDQAHTEFFEHQKERFAPLKALLAELVASIPKEYIEANLYDGRAIISVGRRERSFLSADVRWEIEPNHRLAHPRDEGAGLFREQLGFRLAEKQYFRMPEYDTSELTHCFNTESELIEYLVKKCVEKVGLYEHLKNKNTEEAQDFSGTED